MANCVGWFCAEGRCWEGQDCLKERVGEGEGEGGCRRKDEKMNGEDKKLLGALVGVVSAVDKSGERCLSLNEVDKARVSVKTTCVLCKKNSSQKKKEDGYCECRNGDFLVEKKVLLKMNRYKSSWRQYLADCGKKENKKNTPYRDANGRAIPLTPSLEGPPPKGTKPPRRLMRAEYVLGTRCGRLALVIERACNVFNHHAMLRSCEIFGIQLVCIVTPVLVSDKWHGEKGKEDPKKNEEPRGQAQQIEEDEFVRKITRGSDGWLSLHYFSTTQDCCTFLKDKGYEIWSTHLSKDAENLDKIVEKRRGGEGEGEGWDEKKVAIVVGREADGVSEKMLQNSAKKVYLPMFGFSDSFNVSVAAALTMQRLFDIFPNARASLSEKEKNDLRPLWYSRLAKTPKQAEEYRRWLVTPPTVFSENEVSHMEGVSDEEEGGLLEGVGDGREFSLFGEKKDLWVLPKIRKKQHDLEEGREGKGGKGE